MNCKIQKLKCCQSSIMSPQLMLGMLQQSRTHHFWTVSLLIYSQVYSHTHTQTFPTNRESNIQNFTLICAFIDSERLDGAIIFHISAAFYFFVLLAVVCHDYFLPAVECICEDLNISKVMFINVLNILLKLLKKITLGHHFLCAGCGGRYIHGIRNNCTGIFHQYHFIVCC